MSSIATDGAVAGASDIVVNGNISTTTHVAGGDSILEYFWSAGLLIKLVMIALLISSIWSWTVIITKYLKLKRLRADADYFEESFWSGAPLEDLYKE